MLSDSRRVGLLRLHHLREQGEAVGAEMVAARGRFERLADPANATRAVSSFNLFQTPEGVADRVAALADLSGRVLEPSAGLGRLYRAVRHRSPCPVVLVDISPDCCRELYEATKGDDAARLVQADFLACDAARLGGLFDGVVMNPPFKMGTDIRHIRHALGMLKPGGRLVTICANGPRQRAAFKDRAETWIDLEPGTFDGTNVSAAIVVLT